MRPTELEQRLERLLSPPSGNGRPEIVPPLPVLRPVPVAEPAPARARVAHGGNSAGVATTAPVVGAALGDLRHHKAILDQIPDPVCIKDRNHRWLVVNAAFCDLLGRTEDELIGCAEHDFFPQAFADEAWALDDLVFETGQAVNVERQVESVAGARMWRIALRGQSLLEGEGSTQVLVVTIQDVTAQRRAQRATEYSQWALQTERKEWEERLRKLKRSWLFQFSCFGILAGVSLGIVVAAGLPGRAAANALSTPTAAVAVAGTTPAPTEAPPTITPEVTDTVAPSPTISPTPTARSIVVTAAPTVAAFTADAPQPAPLREFGSQVINIVLMGSDRRPGDGAWRTDVLILVSVDPSVPSVTMLSFPRDLWVYIPGCCWQRINLADGRGEDAGFPGGGPALVKQTIQYNFGIPVHYYARVDFAGYKRLIDSVGGVDVVADCTLYDIFPDVPDGTTDIISGPELATVVTGTIDIPAAGVYHLDGKHALWYARSRKTTSDFDRSRRQQRVLRALWSEMREQGLLAQAPQLWDTLVQAVETDLTLNDVLYLADVAARLDAAHIRSRFIDSSMLTWFATETGASVLRYNYNVLEPYLDQTFAPFPENAASQKRAAVRVVNRTGRPDWEIVAADRLASAGFNVAEMSAENAVAPHTTIVDYTLTPKGSRLNELIESLQAAPENAASRPVENSRVDYEVILGADFEPCQRPAPGRLALPTLTPTSTPTP
jgi:LCP family protein required for cell wall assembly/PAS domain S-box-containing protein